MSRRNERRSSRLAKSPVVAARRRAGRKRDRSPSSSMSAPMGYYSGDDLSPWEQDGWEALCGLCGDGGTLICCDGCPAVLHPACAGVAGIPEDDFYCQSCMKDVCGGCDKGPLAAGDHVICGEEGNSVHALGCGRAFHLACAGLDEVPDGDWLCESCEDYERDREVADAAPPSTPGGAAGKAAREKASKALARAEAAQDGGSRRGAALAWLAAREATHAAHRAAAAVAAKPQLRRIRLVSFAYQKRKGYEPDAFKVFDARCLQHPAVAAAGDVRCGMLRTVPPSRPFVDCWDDDDVKQAKSRAKRRRSTLGSSRRDADRRAEQRKTERRVARKFAFLEDSRDEAGDLDLDGRDAIVRDAVVKDDHFEALVDAAVDAAEASPGEVLTLAYGDLLGKIRSVACVEIIARVLEKAHPDVDVDRIHLDLRNM
jgi:hypothetical protein